MLTFVCPRKPSPSKVRDYESVRANGYKGFSEEIQRCFRKKGKTFWDRCAEANGHSFEPFKQFVSLEYNVHSKNSFGYVLVEQCTPYVGGDLYKARELIARIFGRRHRRSSSGPRIRSRGEGGTGRAREGRVRILYVYTDPMGSLLDEAGTTVRTGKREPERYNYTRRYALEGHAARKRSRRLRDPRARRRGNRPGNAYAREPNRLRKRHGRWRSCRRWWPGYPSRTK